MPTTVMHWHRTAGLCCIHACKAHVQLSRQPAMACLFNLPCTVLQGVTMAAILHPLAV